jgi:hypothetical protein
MHLHPRHHSRDDCVKAPAAQSEDSGEDILHCTFSIVSLDNSPQFEALSYAWGNPKDLTPVALDGHVMLITVNLHRALTRLRQQTEERILWVDALCIDQSNLEERCIQVSQMQYVFRQASTVVVFLGEAWHGSDIAIDYMEMLARDPQLHYDPELEPHADCHGLDAWSEQLFSYLMQLFRLPWFQRTWTVQEFVLAQDVDFVCRDRILRGTDLRDFMSNVVIHFANCCRTGNTFILTQDPKAWDVLSQFQNINLYRVNPREHAKFIRFLTSVRYRQSCDPRDKIYGILSLADPVLQELMQPDYSLSTADTYAKLVSTSIFISQSLDILSCVGPMEFRELDLPSFVPDWSARMEVVWDLFHLARLVAIHNGR